MSTVVYLYGKRNYENISQHKKGDINHNDSETET